jgi:hypothetical protein
MSNLRIVALRRSVVALVASGLLLTLAQPIAATAASIKFAPAPRTSGSYDATKCKGGTESEPCLPCYVELSFQWQDATTATGNTFNYYTSGTFNVYGSSSGPYITAAACAKEALKQYAYYKSSAGGWDPAQTCSYVSSPSAGFNPSMWAFVEITYTQTGSGGVGTAPFTRVDGYAELCDPTLAVPGLNGTL